MTDIEKTEAEIKVLQKKLELLKEIEKHKSPVEEAYKDWWGQYPELETDSEYDEMRWAGFQAGFQAAYEEKVKEDNYYDEVTAQKNTEPYCPDEPEENEWKDVALKFGRKLPVILPYSYDELSPNTWFKWAAFTYDNYMIQRDKKSGYYPSSQTPEPYCPDEPEYYDEVEWDEKDEKAYWGEKDDPNLQKIIDKMVDEHKSQKLYNMLKVQLDYDGMVCDDIVDIVEDWILDEQSASGSQNVNTELLVEGFNDAIRKMKEMLR